MKSDFWHQRWQRREIGFHKEEPNTYLVAHWHKLGLLKGSLIFVPLCGKSQDMLWLTEQGYKVLGVELSEIAVQEFFKEANIDPKITQHGDLVHFESPNISIYCGNLFDLQPSHLHKVHALFDRGALVALPEKIRRIYAAHLRDNLPHNITGLLITMEYDQASMEGPPFAVPVEEVCKLFESFDDITNIATENIKFRDNSVQMRVWKYSRS